MTADENLTFELVVNDGALDSAANTVQITVQHTNVAPVADAGSDQNVSEGAVVSLDGNNSSELSVDPDSRNNGYAGEQYDSYTALHCSDRPDCG
ncbi:MAG: hypothetical protein B5M52_07600 [Helicobacteraceae bacterium 4484_230]|nr:MAG: hypothetical protein B5M52_07600 [Helicobacteraceae bacterium 4484_230]